MRGPGGDNTAGLSEVQTVSSMPAKRENFDRGYDSDIPLQEISKRRCLVHSEGELINLALAARAELLRHPACTELPAAQRNRLETLTFTLDEAKTRRASYNSKTHVVSFSRWLLCGKGIRFEELEDTVLHECAHAVVGVREGHGEVWKKFFCKIGGTGERCGERMDVDYKWTLKCIEQKTEKCANRGWHVRASRKYLATHVCKCGGRLVMCLSGGEK